MTPRKPSEWLLGPALRAQPDQRLVRLAREGSEPAAEEIVRRYRPALLRYAASIVGADQADDVVQDSLARALPRIGSGEGDLHLRPWLYTIARNTALNDLRDAAPVHEQIDENYDGVEQPPQAMERRQRVRDLVVGLQGLPRAQREALIKREMEGRGHAEIGAELGVSTGAARQLIFRGREALRHGLGSLVPIPLLRYLAEGGGDGSAVTATAATGGGALAAKAAVAIVATGAVVTAGVAIRHGERHDRPTPPPGRVRATVPGAGGGNTGVAREVADSLGGRGSNGPEGSGEGSEGYRHAAQGENDGPSNASGHRGGGPSGPDRQGGDGPGRRGSDPSSDGGSSPGGSGRHGGDESEHGGGEGGNGDSSTEAVDSGSSSGPGGGGGTNDGSPSGGEPSGSGSSGHGSPDGGGEDGGGPSTEVPRDPEAGGGLSGVTDQQPKEDG